MARKKLSGKVLALNTPQTAVVDVETVKIHPRYKKRYKMNKKYLTHYENIELKIGDAVQIEEISPISKKKTWIISHVVGGGK